MSYETIINAHRATGGILDVLKAIQAESGYVSDEAIREVAVAYGRFPSEVYETATFYTMLKVGKKAEHIVEVCGSTCCDAAGTREVSDAIAKELGIAIGETAADGKWSFRRCECLGRCDTAPNVVIDGTLIMNARAENVVAEIRKAGK